MGKQQSIVVLFKRYVWVTSFPTGVAYSIYADYSHTQKWKAEKRAYQNIWRAKQKR